MFGKRKQNNEPLGVSVVFLESLGREYERDVASGKTVVSFDSWLRRKTLEIRKMNRATALEVI